MVKLEDKYIKNKLKDKFGEIEIYNPQYDVKILEELTKLIANNSQVVQDNEISDIEVTNTIQIMRFLLSKCSNIESEEYWESIDDIKLENILNLADGDFKKAVNSLLDIMIEIGKDITLDNIRKLDILNNKLNEMAEAIKSNTEIDKTLANFGLDRDKLIKLQNGDEETVKEFQANLIKQMDKPKSKKGRPKTKK